MKAAKFALAMAFAPATLALVGLSGCGSEPSNTYQTKQITNDSKATLADFELEEPQIKDQVANAAGYVVFPDVGKGAAGVAIASGEGQVYTRGDKFIGYAHLGYVGAGADVGGANYSELILFQDDAALNEFENNRVKFDATVSAAIVKAGAAATAKFDKGMMVYVHDKGGFMVEAGVGGQQFTFKAANPQPATQP